MNTHIMNLNPDPLELISQGIKTIEMRLYDERRKKVLVGDSIIFVSTHDSNVQLKVKVKEIHTYPTFKELYERFDKKVLGYSEDEVACHTDMEKYYAKNLIEQYGVIGIEIEVPKI